MRKAQVSVFIVLGILLVLLLGLAIYYGKIQITGVTNQAFEKVIVDPELQPVFNYVSECVRQYGEEGITLIGQHGGYIKPAFSLNRNNPTESEAVEFSPGSNMLVPYWYFLSDGNMCEGKCQFRSKQPPLRGTSPSSIETQLSTYVQNNLKNCIGQFEVLEEQGIKVTETGKPTITTTITGTSVILFAQYPLTIVKGDKQYQLDKYPVEIPVRLQDMYDLASTLTELESNHSYLEKNLRQLIDIYSGTDSSRLPPTSELQFDFSAGPIWSRTEVESRIRGLLTSYTPLLQVFGTSNYHRVTPFETVNDPEEFDKLYNRNMLIVTSPDRDWRAIEAHFNYLDWWKLYFNLDGCSGDICRPEALLNTLMQGVPYGIQRYFFTYDVSYPVVVTLKDPNALNGKGLTFAFAIEANMRNNDPMPAEFNPLKKAPGGASLMCEPHLATSRPIALDVIDSMTTAKISGAQILYTCGQGEDEESCPITTTTNETDTVKFPRCIGGMLTIEKEGYGSSSVYLDTDSIPQSQLTFQLDPISKADLSLKRYRLFKENGAWTLQPQAVSLDPEEEAMIMLTKKTKPLEEPFTASAYFLGDLEADDNYGSHKGIQLQPGEYDVEITTVLRPSQPIVIPPQEICTGADCVKVPDAPIEFNYTNPLPLGGARFTTTITSNDLARSREIEFYAIDSTLDLVPEDERTIDDMDTIGNQDKYGESYGAILQPVFS